jgi:hypothetical protein
MSDPKLDKQHEPEDESKDLPVEDLEVAEDKQCDVTGGTFFSGCWGNQRV